jgi:hypothetical protein
VQGRGGLRLRQLPQRIQSLSHQPLGLVLLGLELPQGSEGRLQAATGGLDGGGLIDRRRLAGSSETGRVLFHQDILARRRATSQRWIMTPMPKRIAVLLTLLVVAVGGACGDDGEPQVSGKPVHDLSPGDCFVGRPFPPKDAGAEKRTVLLVAAVSCSKAHDKEVFAVFDHPAKPDGAFPGEDEVAKVAQDGCAERFEGYVRQPFGESDLQVAVIAPGPVPWDKDNDRRIVCTLQGTKALKGSKKAAGG